MTEAPITGVPSTTRVIVPAIVAPVAGTVKVMPLLEFPPTFTTTGPVVAKLGTGTAMMFVVQLVAWASVPLKVILRLPTLFPKPEPVMVTGTLVEPDVGVMPVIEGLTVKVVPVLGAPFTVTTTGPVDAVAGTGKVMLVSFHAFGMATSPFRVTALPPWATPNLLPVIATEVPVTPDVGERLLMVGVGKVVGVASDRAERRQHDQVGSIRESLDVVQQLAHD